MAKEKKETKEERHWKKYKTKRDNAIMLMVYCALLALIGTVVLMSGLSEKTMYNTLKDDEYLTDDGLAYRDMGNATYTYPVSEIDKLAEQSNWAIVFGIVILVASACLVFSMAWIMPEKTEIHTMLCRQWQNEQFAGNDGLEDMDYCPECGLKLSRLEKK